MEELGRDTGSHFKERSSADCTKSRPCEHVGPKRWINFLRHSKVLTRFFFFDGVIVDLNPCIYAYCRRTKEYTMQSAHIKLNPLLMSRSRISCFTFFSYCAGG